jgi:hypothetical protein
MREEMPERFSTRSGFKSLFKTWLQPKWKDVPVTDFRPLEVEHWLKSLPLSASARSRF